MGDAPPSPPALAASPAAAAAHGGSAFLSPRPHRDRPSLVAPFGDRRRRGLCRVQQHRPVALRPGGKYIGLRGLKGPLALEDSFAVTLRFANAGEIAVTVMVEDGPDH